MEKMVIISESELTNLIRVTVTDILENKINAKPPKATIKGIKGLAAALNCSVSKAMKLKKSGVIRYFQDQKLLLFDYDQVIEDLKGQNINKRGRRSKIN